MNNSNVTPNTNPAIEINKLRFGYPAAKDLIHIDSWQVLQEEQIFLYGASGSGKSTLLNLISGILIPQQGEINLLGESFTSLPSSKRDSFRAKHIGVIFQEFNLIPFLTIAENIELATHFTQGRKHKRVLKTHMFEIFERLKLHKNLLNQRADNLSVGQRQRVSIARALVNNPEILIADEPTSALDTENRDEFMKLLLETAHDNKSSKKCTVLFVSHDKTLASHFKKHIDIKTLLSSND